MKTFKAFIFLFFITSRAFTQEAEVKEMLKFNFDKETSKTFFKNSHPSIYLDDQGKYVILNNTEQMLLIASDGSVKLKKQHLEPVTKFTAVALDMMKESNPDHPHIQMMPDLSFEEGAGYYVFDKQDIAIVQEFTLNKNLIYAVDLNSGDELWSNDKYRYTTDEKSQLTKALAGLAVQRFLNSVAMHTNFSSPASVFAVNGLELNSQILFSQKASPEASSWITPVEGTDLFLLKTNDALVCLDLKTGEEKWSYESPINVAFSELNDNRLVLINYTASYLSSSEKNIVSLDVNTGEELWRTTYLSEFLPDRTTIVEDRLILDYYGTELFDIHTGERLLLSIDESIVKAQNTMMNLLGGGDNNDHMAQSVEPALIDDQFIYTSTYTSMGKKYPNMGGGKIQLQKYELSTGKLVWESDKLDRGLSMENVISEDLVLGKVKGFNKRSFIIVDTNSGEMTKETDAVASMLFRERPADLWMDEVVFRGGKKDIYAFYPADWSIMKEIDVNSADVGKIQTIGVNGNGIIAICDKGVAFYDKEAELADKFEIKNIQSSAQHGKDLLLFTKDQMILLDVNKPDQHASYHASPENGDKQWLFSPESKFILTINDEELVMLQL